MQPMPGGVAYLDGVRMRRALTAGIQRVIAHQDHLNKINVFPVPDGDTGTNIAFTLSSVLGGMSSSVERHVGRLMTTIADAALDGARGNSGAIFAQFFQGLSDAVGNLPQITVERFVEAVHKGADYAREALAEPREGTLVTVLRDFAEELKTHLQNARDADFLPLLERGLRRAEQSLADTPRQLAVLRRAGVVDAGAEGFVDLLRGIFEFARSGSLRDRLAVETAAAGTADGLPAEETGADSEHRYCTECVVTGEAIDLRKLREELSALGSSLVVAGGTRKAKVHIHVNEPQTVFRLAQGHGRVQGQKADDMWQQRREAGSDNSHAVAVITDSGADIPEAELERLNIHVVPVRVHFGDQGYLDKVSLTPAEFYRLQAEHPEPPRTSQPPPGDFRRQFQLLASHFEAVVSVNLTASVSGTWQAAVSAAERAEGAAVSVIDSRNVSVGQGLLVLYAAECARAGLSAGRIRQAVEIMRDRTRTWGLIPDLSHAVRGGRVSRSKQWLVDLLKLTPVLHKTPDGRITAGGVLPGRANLPEKFRRFVLRRLKAGRRHRLLVGHANNPAAGQALLEALRAGTPGLEKSWLVDMGCALGAHAGPGALVVAAQEYLPPEELPGLSPEEESGREPGEPGPA